MNKKNIVSGSAPHLQLADTAHGKGVFARSEFLLGNIILEMKGPLLTYEQLPSPYHPEKDHYLQVGEALYLGPSGGLDDYVNHSCNPNTGLVFRDDRFLLVAIRKISSGEQITMDYSTTLDEDEWEMPCACEEANCRKIIQDFVKLPQEVRERYVRLGIVPEFLAQREINGNQKER